MFDKYILFSNFPCVCSSFVSLVEVLCLFLCTLDCRGAMRQECYVGIYFWTLLNFTSGTFSVCVWRLQQGCGMSVMLASTKHFWILLLEMYVSGKYLAYQFLFSKCSFYSISFWGLQQGCSMRVMFVITVKDFWHFWLCMYLENIWNIFDICLRTAARMRHEGYVGICF